MVSTLMTPILLVVALGVIVEVSAKKKWAKIAGWFVLVAGISLAIVAK